MRYLTKVVRQVCINHFPAARIYEPVDAIDRFLCATSLPIGILLLL